MMDQHATDYHLAQLIESPLDHVKTLVAEVAGKAVGFMSLSSRLDYNVLAESYHLESFETLLQDQKPKRSAVTQRARLPPKFFNTVSLSRSLDALNGGLKKSMSKNLLTRSISKASIQDLSGSQPYVSSPLKKSVVKLTHGISQNSVRKDAGRDAAQIDETPTTTVDIPERGSHQALQNATDESKLDLVQRDDNKTINAFCVTLFCIDDRFEGMAAEFLKTAFEMFPDREYCLLTLPTDVPESHLLQAFTRVPHKLDYCPPHCLYIANRFAVEASIHIRRATAKDAEPVYDMIQDLPNESELVTLLKKCKVGEKASKSKRPVCLVVEAYEQLIGFVVVDYFNAEPYIEQFDVEDFVDVSKHDLVNKPCLFRNMVLNPLFVPHAREVLSNVFRLLKTTCLFYPMDQDTRHDVATRQLVTKEFVPVRRRRQVQYPDNLRDGTPMHPPLPHALRFFSVNLMHEPRLVRNAQIVIVGSSDTGLAFAQELVYTAHLEFTNITLVSTDGLATYEEGEFLASSLCFDAMELKQSGLENYINVVPGTVTAIHRNLKQVELRNGQFVPYDYLMLTPGLQFTSASISDKLSAFTNVLGVNRYNALDVDVAMQECVHSQYWPDAGETVVVIYGKDVQSYAVIQGLLAKGVQASKIVLVLPETKQYAGSVFENVIVESKVNEALKRLGVKVFQGQITEFKSNDDRITAVTITSPQSQPSSLELSCQLLLCVHARSVDTYIFSAINDACLVFDGRLVIDAHFRTHDPFVYAHLF